MKKIARRVTVTLAIVLLSLSLIFLTGAVAVTVFAKKNVDLSADERLFQGMKGQNVTEYYAAESFSDKTPVLSESVSYCENKKLWTSIEECSRYLTEGFLSVEDREFYRHHGVNIKRTLYALSNSVFHFKRTFGASTVTQQVVKNISGDNEVTFRRKLTEMIRAHNIEQNHTKDEIFELYLNVIPMGENLIGVGAASETFFGKSAQELNAQEAATLIGIANAPSRYNPYDNYKVCLEKRNVILGVMHEEGVISSSEYESAVKTPIILNSRRTAQDNVNSWFAETVNEDVITALAQKMDLSYAVAGKLFYTGGFKVYTTENKEVQTVLEEYFENASNFPDACSGGLEFAMAVCDAETADLIGIVGSVGKKSGNKLLNMATAPHTPGSALKPLALYAPLINDKAITWSTVFDDVPVEFLGATNTPYPKNYPEIYDGLLPVKDALRLSKNTVAMRLYEMLGAERIYSILKQDLELDGLIRRRTTDDGGIVTDLAPAPLALGQLSYGVSLRRLTEAYTVFSRGGRFSRGRSFTEVYDSEGNLILKNQPETKRIFSEEATAVMNKLLSEVVESGTASAITLNRSVDVAGKTGTSGDDKDRLFVGYTPYVTAGIWCGYRTSDKKIGRIAPNHLKIWDEVMKRVHERILTNVPEYEIKSFSEKGIVRAEYCRDSGELYTPTCAKDPRGSRMDVGYFIKGTEPKILCDRHVLCKYDKGSEAVANDLCPEELLTETALVRVETRAFPRQIIVTDAEYVYRSIGDSVPVPEDYTEPYFFYAIPDGEYVGKSGRRKQYNSGCYIHAD